MFRILSFFIIAAFASSVAHANVVGVDTQNFNPVTNGLDFVTVHSSETLEPGLINLGLFWNLAGNTLPNLENVSDQSLTEVTDTLLSMDFNLGLGLTRNWDIGVSFPQILNQSVDADDDTVRGYFEETGLTEIRFNTKYRLFGTQSSGMAAIFSLSLPQIENNPFSGVDPGPTYTFELAFDTRISEINWGLNIGYRMRNPGESLINEFGFDPFGDQFIASLAASYFVVPWDTKLIAEIYGSSMLEDTSFTSDRDVSTLELLLGAKWSVTQQVALHAGFGTEMIHGTASPDWRIYTGINWTFGSLWSSEPNFAEVIYEDRGQDQMDVVVIDDNLDVFYSEPTQPVETFIARDVLFAFDSDEVKREFFPILAKLANYLQKGQGFVRLIITGHTDSIGTEAYNMNLSMRRANSVRELLLRVTDLPESKIYADGKGESMPIADNGNYQGRQLNRRVEFKIIRDKDYL